MQMSARNTTRPQSADSFLRELRHALENNQLKSYYQPIFSLQTHRICGHEALCHWDHPAKGILTAPEFVPYAEATGVIAEIDMTMLTTVLHDLQMVSEHTPLDMAISFNLSVATLTYPGFLNFLYDLLSRYDMSGIKLCAEVTETMALSSHFDSQRVIHAMSDLGIRISIDDFGTGFSSLSLLREFPVNELKIDRSFTAGIAWDSPDLAIIKSIALLGHELDMHIVAEGVETEFQATALKDLGVHAGQGHYFGKPQLRPVFQNDSV